MNIKRVLSIALTLYVANFIVGIILTQITKKMFASIQNASTGYWLITLTVTVLMTGLAGLWYFNGKNVTRNRLEGLKLGIVFVVSNFIIDLLYLIPTMIVMENSEGIFDYYKSTTFYLIGIIVIGTTVFVGSRNQTTETKNKSKKNKE